MDKIFEDHKGEEVSNNYIDVLLKRKKKNNNDVVVKTIVTVY